MPLPPGGPGSALASLKGMTPPQSSYLPGDQPTLTPDQLGQIGPGVFRGGAATNPRRGPPRFQAFDIRQSGQPRFRLPDEITEAARLSEDVRGLVGAVGAGGVVTGAALAEDVPGAQPGPKSVVRGMTAPVGNSGAAIRDRLRRSTESELAELRKDINELIDLAGGLVDPAAEKAAKVRAEKLAENVIHLAGGIMRAPGVEIGTSIFTGTAGAGEEAAIEQIRQQERALRQIVIAQRLAQQIQTGTGGVALNLVRRDP